MSDLTDKARADARIGLLGSPGLLVALADRIDELEAELAQLKRKNGELDAMLGEEWYG